MAFDLTCPADLSKLQIVGTDSDVTWAEVVDHPGGVDKDGGGTEPVSTFVTETVENGVYIIHKDVEFGDGTNSLTFNSLNEMVYFVDDVSFQIKDNATLNLGEKQGDNGLHGSMWSVGDDATCYFINTVSTAAVFNMYASLLRLRTDQIYYWGHGSYELLDSIISGTELGCSIYFRYGTGVITNLFANKVERVYVYSSTVTITNLHLHTCFYGLYAYDDLDVTGLLITEQASTYEVAQSTAAKTLSCINPLTYLSTVYIGNATSVIKEQYSCDLLAVDEDGIILTGADILCQRTALVSWGSKAWRAKRENTNKLPDENPGDWEDVSSIHDYNDIVSWTPLLTYYFEEEVFDELQADRIEIDCDDHAAIEGTYVQQASSEDYNGERTYKLEGSSWYIWKGATWWTLSAEVGNTAGAYVGGATPYTNYEAPGDPYFDSAVPTQLETLPVDTQYLDRQTWETTGELQRNWEYEFIITHSDYPALTLPRCLVTEIIDWRIDMGLSTSDVEDALESALENNVLNTVGKMFVNKAVQNKNTGVVQYYDDDGETVILTHTPSDEESEITRTPS